jgi:2-dehydro-3-deoxyphosphogluconate aldolase/(4S)-4-hydroxy-2-oxoglutarate aldolase
VKFFPAELSGGIKMINAVGAALTKLKFMPTGGVSASNAADYLRCERVFCAGGSWMVKKDLMQAGEWDTILGLVKEASAIVRKVRTAAE